MLKTPFKQQIYSQHDKNPSETHQNLMKNCKQVQNYHTNLIEFLNPEFGLICSNIRP